jgi:transposase
MMPQEDWMNLLALRPLIDSGVPWAEIGRLAGCDPRTAKKYFTGGSRPLYGPRPPAPKLIDPYTGVIDEWLRASGARILSTTIFERLVAPPYEFPGSYQRVKEYVHRRRPEVAIELGLRDPKAEMHRRFEVAPGSQAQVDWGDEGTIWTPQGEVHVSSFHMVLSYSRDPFCRYTASQDLATFWGAHTDAFHHFGGIPGTILYDRTKTVVRRHVGRGQLVPLHPEALAFAAHYGFSIRLCEGYRPQTKGRVERAVEIGRTHVLQGRTFTSLGDMQRAYDEWLPIRRAQVHRTHGEVIAVRAERDRAALRPSPPRPYVVTERHIRAVGKDALIHFEGSCYSVPWTKVRPRQRVEVRAGTETVSVFTLGGEPELLSAHPRATSKGSWVVQDSHWDGLPDGAAPSRGPTSAPPSPTEGRPEDQASLAEILRRLGRADVSVGRRDPGTYDGLFGVSPGRGPVPDPSPGPENGSTGLLWPRLEGGTR